MFWDFKGNRDRSELVGNFNYGGNQFSFGKGSISENMWKTTGTISQKEVKQK